MPITQLQPLQPAANARPVVLQSIPTPFDALGTGLTIGRNLVATARGIPQRLDELAVPVAETGVLQGRATLDSTNLANQLNRETLPFKVRSAEQGVIKNDQNILRENLELPLDLRGLELINTGRDVTNRAGEFQIQRGQALLPGELDLQQARASDLLNPGGSDTISTADAEYLRGLDPKIRVLAQDEAVRRFGSRAGSKPEAVVAMARVLEEKGGTAQGLQDFIDVSTMGEDLIKELPEVVDVFGWLRSTGTKEAKAMEQIDGLRDVVLGNTNQAEVTDQLFAAAREGLDIKVKQEELQIRTLMQQAKNLERALKDVESKTGFIGGTAEQIANRFGQSTDPALRQAANRVTQSLSAFLAARSGMTVTEQEFARLSRIFPQITNSAEVNSANISAMIAAGSDDLADFWLRQGLPKSVRDRMPIYLSGAAGVYNKEADFKPEKHKAGDRVIIAGQSFTLEAE